MLPDDEAMMKRVQAEYREMPGLMLTPEQAARLWGLDPSVCQAVLERLVAGGWLRRTAGGAYVATGEP